MGFLDKTENNSQNYTEMSLCKEVFALITTPTSSTVLIPPSVRSRRLYPLNCCWGGVFIRLFFFLSAMIVNPLMYLQAQSLDLVLYFLMTR